MSMPRRQVYCSFGMLQRLFGSLVGLDVEMRMVASSAAMDLATQVEVAARLL